MIHKPHLLMDAKSGKVDGIMAERGPERIQPMKQEPGDVGPVEIGKKLKRRGFGGKR